ncbi:hypothetical protein HDU91_006358, partial [Kappamyces sp. JEL0680]
MTLSLSLEAVQNLAASGFNTIPIWKQLESDILTPISAYLKLSRNNEKYSFLFESILGGEKIGRYSFLGVGPRKVLQDFQGRDPTLVIQEELAHVKPYKAEGLPGFTGGAVGFISYDCVQYFEPSTKTADLKDPLGIPDAVLMLCDTIVIFDHLYSVVKVCSNVLVDDHRSSIQVSSAYRTAADAISLVELLLLSEKVVYPPQDPLELGQEAVSNVGEQGYKDFVAKVKANIVTGDVIQVVPSQRVRKPTQLHPFNAYRRLRTVNPSPYMFYVDLGAFQLVGASPEMLVKVEDGKVEMHPIAGKTPEEDEALALDLISDLKERSEHVMLVDLGRNDVNRVCDPKTVKVDSLMHIERYAHVMHIVSHVSGHLRPDQTAYDAFRSIFPAGTVSGAPKVRAMQIIYELEKEKRGVYAGAVGYFGYSGGLDTCIAIRTMLFKDGNVYLQA